MTEAERAAAHALQHDERTAYQAWLDTQLAASGAAETALDDQWQAMTDYVREGPDVGEADEAGSEGDQRIN